MIVIILGLILIATGGGLFLLSLSYFIMSRYERKKNNTDYLKFCQRFDREYSNILSKH